jgi:alpha-beta hydrolase superfamily lysophospholipase
MTLWWNYKPDITFDKASLGDDLDLYLSSSEGRLANIRPGLAKEIVWADPTRKAPTAFSIVYLHGFSASSGEIRPVPDLVAQHLGANLYFTRQTGHGMDGEALGRATIEAWVNDIAEAIAIGERLGNQVIVMATSTGAALATWALTEPALTGKIAAAVLLSANYRLQARGAFLLSSPFARQIVRVAIGKTRGFEPINAAHARLWTHHYSTDALLPMAKAMQLANRAPVETTRVPALFFYSPRDTVVDPRRIVEIAERWGAPHTLIAVAGGDDPSGHVIAGDALAPSTTRSVAADICGWLDKLFARRHDNVETGITRS